MKQTLQLRLGQQLAMTPQLRQAIHLLQLSTLDLQTEVQEALDSNLMLEDGADDPVETAPEAGIQNEGASTSSENPDLPGSKDQASNGEAKDGMDTPAEQTNADSNTTEEKTEIPEELPMDADWDEIYDTGQTSYSASGDDQGRDILDTRRASQEETLQEHLNWQLELTPFSNIDRLIADAIIDSIGDDGYLMMPLEEIHEGLIHIQQDMGMDLSNEEIQIELEEVEAVLHRIQQFDPIGVASANLSECLTLQLQALPKDLPNRQTALLITKRYLELLGSRDLKQLMRRVKINQDTLDDIIDLIRSLNPKPGAKFTPNTAQYIVPDVFVRKIKGIWQVEPNADAMPRLRINNLYAGMVKRADNSPDNSFLRNNLQEARWFIKSLKSRHETLLKVARAIVLRQENFLEIGDEGMQPLVLRDIAEAVEMHESTISRVTTQKYMHTPRGIYEFKYFFSSHVGTADGGECSATAIRAMIKKMTVAEDPAKPLSDNKIANVLGEQGIKVARRTVAKYRESMGIPPSNERKRLK